jgi:hypothetical protein
LAWFRPVKWTDAKREERRSYDLTRNGLLLLVMGRTGPNTAEYRKK